MKLLDGTIDDLVNKRRREREMQRIKDASMEAAKSGGLSAAVVGGAHSLLSGHKLSRVLADSGMAGLGMGALAGGGTYLGSQILGAPKEGESGGFTNRAGLGGALAGGALGAGLGGLLGSGKLGWLSKIPQVGAALAERGPLNNLLTDQVKKVAKTGAGRTAAALGLGGAAIGGGVGANEGMAVDYLSSLDDEENQGYGPY